MKKIINSNYTNSLDFNLLNSTLYNKNFSRGSVNNDTIILDNGNLFSYYPLKNSINVNQKKIGFSFNSFFKIFVNNKNINVRFLLCTFIFSTYFKNFIFFLNKLLYYFLQRRILNKSRFFSSFFLLLLPIKGGFSCSYNGVVGFLFNYSLKSIFIKFLKSSNLLNIFKKEFLFSFSRHMNLIRIPCGFIKFEGFSPSTYNQENNLYKVKNLKQFPFINSFKRRNFHFIFFLSNLYTHKKNN